MLARFPIGFPLAPPRSRGAAPRSRRAAAGRLVGCVLLPALAWAGTASAGVLAVPRDHATIGAALAAARPGDVVLVSCGDYLEHDLEVGPGVRLWSGTLQPDCATIDARGAGRVLDLARADSLTAVVGFTLRGGSVDDAGGAVRILSGRPKLASCVIRESVARDGGGLHVGPDAAPRVEGCVFEGNLAERRGGAVSWLGAGGGLLQGGRAEHNAALSGGAVAIAEGAEVTVRNVVFATNTAANSGGAVAVDRGRARFESCIFDRNSGGLGGGALASIGGAPVVVGCTFYRNRAEHAGGALLLLAEASATLERCILSDHPLAPIAAPGTHPPVLAGCNLHGNADGDWSSLLETQQPVRGNFSRAPLFCAPEQGDFRLAANSPCLPGRSPGIDGLVGARGRGCDRSPLAASSPMAGLR
ncbi:MAG: hypothetical protein R6X25_07745 [Candidatus Krumholzibacteriia bacterium]